MNIWFPHNADNMWDQSLLKFLISGSGFTRNPPTNEGLVIIASGVVLQDRGDTELRQVLSRVPWVLIIYTSDESRQYDIKRFDHHRMKLWTQYINIPGAKHIPIGYSPNCCSVMEKLQKLPLADRKYKWSFAGQVNHEHRTRMVEQLNSLSDGKLIITGGFAQGLPQNEYYKLLTETAISLCPAGNRYPDSFRIWESLEAGCLPIAEERGLDWEKEGYWNQIKPPFPIVKDWSELQSLLPMLLSEGTMLQQKVNECKSWWNGYKQALLDGLISDVKELSG